MAYTETKTESYGSRIGGSFKGIVTGIMLLAAGTWLLYWNEGRTVANRNAIGEAGTALVSVADITTADPANEGKLIHVTGRADTKDILTDPVLGVSTSAIKLSRSVEFYQWVEHEKSVKKKKLGGGEETVTTYTYSKEWSKSPVNSSSFKGQGHDNAVMMEIKNDSWLAPTVTLGAYLLPDFLKRSIGGDAEFDVTLSSDKLAELNAQLTGIPVQTAVSADTPAASADMSSASVDVAAAGLSSLINSVKRTEVVHMQGSVIYIGAKPAAPAIGDVRVKYTRVMPADVSLIAKVIRNTFEPFTAANGNTFSKLSMGTVSAENMIGAAQRSNDTQAWIIRAIGLFIIIFGLKCVLAPLSVLASVIPLLGDIVGAGGGAVAFILGVVWSLLVIAVAWLRFRPLLGGGLVAAAAVLLGVLFARGRAAKKSA